MNQHYIQRAWLARFAGKSGRVRRVCRVSLRSREFPPKKVASEADFQKVEAEVGDGKIERQGVKVLEQLAAGVTEQSASARDELKHWVALHLTRSLRSREGLGGPGPTYDDARQPFLQQDIDRVSSFQDVYLLTCNAKDEPLILSDNPIMFLAGVDVVFPISPSEFVMLTSRDPEGHQFDAPSWAEMVNDVSFASSDHHCFCSPDASPDWEAIRQRNARAVRVEKTPLLVLLPLSKP
jgi:hypothetical protein